MECSPGHPVTLHPTRYTSTSAKRASDAESQVQGNESNLNEIAVRELELVHYAPDVLLGAAWENVRRGANRTKLEDR
jgi:hypothetical protein